MTLQLASLEESRTGAVEQAISPAELDYMAYSGKAEIVHGVFRSIDPSERIRYASKYILHEVITAGIRKLRTFLAASEEMAAQKEKEFIDETLQLFVRSAQANGLYPRELFASMLDWAEELHKLSLVNKSLKLYERAIASNVSRFPDLQVRALRGKADLVNARGQVDQGYAILSSLAAKTYLVPDRNQLPGIMLDLGKTALLTGKAYNHAAVMFRGLRHFYLNMDQRRMFVDQLRTTYRGTSGLMLHPTVPIGDKVLFLIHLVYFVAARFRFLRLVRVPSVLRFGVLGYVYLLNYLRPETTPSQKARLSVRTRGDSERANIGLRAGRKDFLITRAMGGIGDLLMMTPGFRALKAKYPHETIHLAIPRRYFSIFAGNSDVELLDIEDASLDIARYRKWFNFTDCPASRKESRTAPRVQHSRIDIFSRALGIGWIRRWHMDHHPRYVITEEEQLFQRTFWRTRGLDGKRVIGIQLHADETYRNYPHMETVVRILARTMTVLLFDGEGIGGMYPDSVIKVDSLPLRQAFALARACDAIIAPDSSFVHFAAAFDIPCVGLYGPIDGKIRTKHYTKCIAVDARSDLRCVPCWRNESIPCKLTNLRGSACMIDLEVQQVLSAVHSILEKDGTT